MEAGRRWVGVHLPWSDFSCAAQQYPLHVLRFATVRLCHAQVGSVVGVYACSVGLDLP